MYEITKVNKYFKAGAKVTHERFIKNSDSIDEVLGLAKKQGADIDEVKQELEEYGYTTFKGYMITEW